MRVARALRWGIAALVLVVGTAAAVVYARSRDTPGPPGEPPHPARGSSGGIAALWPEHTLAALKAAEERVGADVDTWRLDATATAEKFARRVLHWHKAEAQSCARLCGPDPSGSDAYRSVTSRGGHDLSVRLRQLSPSSGVWSVVGVGSQSLPMGFHVPSLVGSIEPGTEVQAGDTVQLRSRLSSVAFGMKPYVSVGYVYFDPCGTESFGVWSDRHPPYFRFEVGTADLNPSCGGSASGGSEVRLSRPVDGVIFAVSSDHPRFGYDSVPIELFGGSRGLSPRLTTLSIGAVAVRFVPAGGGPAPSVPNDAQAITCADRALTDLSKEPDYAADYLSRWQTADGCTVRLDVVSWVHQGCDLVGVDQIGVGWPFGSLKSPPTARSFIRDPEGLSGVGSAARFRPDARLPSDAVDTRLRRNGQQLWIVPNHDRSVWLVSADRTERWPNDHGQVGCF